VVLWRLRYKLALRDLPEMFLIRGIVFSHEAVRDWETKLTPALAESLRRRRRGKVGRSWYVDETYIKVHWKWRYRRWARGYDIATAAISTTDWSKIIAVLMAATVRCVGSSARDRLAASAGPTTSCATSSVPAPAPISKSPPTTADFTSFDTPQRF
jgi:hypothetical protein